jgi:hypothetical protein
MQVKLTKIVFLDLVYTRFWFLDRFHCKSKSKDENVKLNYLNTNCCRGKKQKKQKQFHLTRGSVG